MEDLSSTFYRTRFGGGTLLWRSGLLVAHWLPGDARGEPAPPSCKTPWSSQLDLALQLESYFAGAPVDFVLDELPLYFEGMSTFTRDVTAALAATGRGELLSYAALAAAAGYPGAARAVGNLMAANPWPVIVPCHRVVRSDGGLGGFAGGAAWKQCLLELEGR